MRDSCFTELQQQLSERSTKTAGWVHTQSTFLNLFISSSSLSYRLLVRKSFLPINSSRDLEYIIAGVATTFWPRAKLKLPGRMNRKPILIGHLLYNLSHLLTLQSGMVSLCDRLRKWKLRELKGLALRLFTKLSHRNRIWTQVQRSKIGIL